MFSGRAGVQGKKRIKRSVQGGKNYKALRPEGKKPRIIRSLADS
jgi:hypothetical protein